MRHALVDGVGVVVNVILLEDGADWSAPPHLAVIKDESGEAAPGGFFDGRSFSPPTPRDSVRSQPDEKERLTAIEAENADLKRRLEALESKAAATEPKKEV